MVKKSLMNIKKGSIVLVSAFIANKLEMFIPIIMLLMFFMSIDYISGMLASKKEATDHPDNKNLGWNSKKGIMGIYKKMRYILIILAAISVDFILYTFIQRTESTYHIKVFCGSLVTIWFILNEFVSILKNVNKMNIILPQFLLHMVLALKNDMDDYNMKQ